MPETPAEEHPPDGAPVDSSGHPEGPVQQAVEKSKNENRIKAGLALAAIGIVVAVMLARRSSRSAGAAQNAGGAPNAPLDATGGAGIDSSYLQSLQGQLGSQAASIAHLQGSQDATQRMLDARTKNEAKVLQDLKHRLAILQNIENHTPAEHRAHRPPMAHPARQVDRQRADALRAAGARGFIMR